MPRPVDEKDKPLPWAHLRLAEAPMLRQAGAFALATDSRSAMWDRDRRLARLNAAIDHVVDGRAVPKAVFDTHEDTPNDHTPLELWNLAVGAIRQAWGRR
jgi:hypothetical protein